MGNAVKINLQDYIPQRKSTNCIVFTLKKHAELLKTIKQEPKVILKNSAIIDNELEINDKDVKTYINSSTNTKSKERTKSNLKNIKTKVIKSKDFVPLILTKSDSMSPIIFTVKRKKKHHQSFSNDFSKSQNKTYKDNNRDKCSPRKINMENKKHFKNTNYGSISIGNKTISDKIINKHLSSDISEISKSKFSNTVSSAIHDFSDSSQIISNSFETLENQVADHRKESSNKIIFMSDKQSMNMTKSVRDSVMKAIKECLTEIKEYKNEPNDIKILHGLVKANTLKLNKIYEKLINIENCVYKIKHEERISESMQDSKHKILKEDLHDVINLDYRSKENINVDGKNDNLEIIDLVSPDCKQNQSHSSEVSNSLENRVSFIHSNIKQIHKIHPRYCWTDDVHKNT